MYALTLSKRKILSTFIFALTLNAVVLHWSSTFVGSVPWLILAVGMSLFYLPLALVSRWGIASYPLVYIVMEEVRNRFPFGGFGWVRLAYTQADSPYSKITAIGGVVALSATVVLIGLMIFYLFQKRFSLITVIPFMLVLIPINTTYSGDSSVMLVQGNVPELGLEFNSRAKAVFKNHFELTKKALTDNSEVDFVVWPENAVDVDPFQNLDVKSSLDSIQKPLIIGAIVYKGNKLLNTSICT